MNTLEQHTPPLSSSQVEEVKETFQNRHFTHTHLAWRSNHHIGYVSVVSELIKTKWMVNVFILIFKVCCDSTSHTGIVLKIHIIMSGLQMLGLSSLLFIISSGCLLTVTVRFVHSFFFFGVLYFWVLLICRVSHLYQLSISFILY